MGESKTLSRPDGPDRWADQIRHIDVYQTRRDNANVQVLSDPCGEEGDSQANGWFQKAGTNTKCSLCQIIRGGSYLRPLLCICNGNIDDIKEIMKNNNTYLL